MLELENLSLGEIESRVRVGTSARALAALMTRGQFPELWRLPALGTRDFVIESGGVLNFVECKWNEQPSRRDARTIVRVAADLEASGSPWRSGRHYVLGRPAATHTIVPGVRAIGIRDLAAVVAGREPG